MRYKRGGGKEYETEANERNTPHLKENTIIIVLSYFFSGLNFIISGLLSPEWADLLIFLGIMMLSMVPLSILDKRREMRGMLATALAAAMLLAYCTGLAIIFSFWWMIVYLCESALCAGIICYTKNQASKQLSL